MTTTTNKRKREESINGEKRNKDKRKDPLPHILPQAASSTSIQALSNGLPHNVQLVIPLVTNAKRSKEKSSSSSPTRPLTQDIPRAKSKSASPAQTKASLGGELSKPRSEKRKEKGKEKATSMACPELATSSYDVRIYTTPVATILTFQNAGMHLTHWCQAVNHQLTFVYENVLPPDPQPPVPSKRSLRRQSEGLTPVPDERSASLPPQGSYRECTVMLPILGLVRSGVPLGGIGWTSKQLAKRSASFEAVKLLLQRGEMDDSLRPTPSAPREPTPPKSGETSTKSRSQIAWDKLKSGVEDRLPPPSPNGKNGQKGNGDYPYISTPNFWSTCPPFKLDQLYATLIELHIDPPHTGKNPCRPLVLITSRPFPFLAGGRTDLRMSIGDQPSVSATMVMLDCGKMKSWEEGKLELALRFTERLMRAALQRPLKGKLDTAKWLVVPLKAEMSISTLQSSSKHRLQRRDIAWDEAETVANGPISTPFDIINPEVISHQCKDALVTLPGEFSRRSYFRKLRTDLTPSSPHPLKPEQTIYACLKAQQASLPAPILPEQPVLEVELVRTPKHGGYPLQCALSDTHDTIFVLPEHVHLHCIPASVLRTTTVLPHFFNELESTLIAHEMNASLFSSALDDRLALQAITTPASCLDMARHYERTEFIGDTLLKLIVTIHAYLADVQGSKGIEKTMQDRHVMSSNRTLRANAVKVGLPQYIRTKKFKAKGWVPRDWTLDWTEEMGSRYASAKGGECTSEPVLESHQMGDKVLADVLEALIGASYVASCDLDDVLTMMHQLDIPLKGMHKWSDLGYSLPPAPHRPKEEKGYMAFFNSKSTKILGYDFKDREKVDEILSLDMNKSSRKTTFDRYKFLGNAVLDYFVVEHLCEVYPDEGPASLTNMKASRTAEGVRSALGVELGLVDLLRDGDDQTRSQVNKIKAATKRAKLKADQAREAGRIKNDHAQQPSDDVKASLDGVMNDASGGGRTVGLEWWADVAIAHTTSDPLEALLGAITHDSSFDLTPARKIFDTYILPFMETYCLPPHSLCSHPKANLIRWLQARGCEKWAVERFYPGQVVAAMAGSASLIGADDGPNSTAHGSSAEVEEAGKKETKDKASKKDIRKVDNKMIPDVGGGGGKEGAVVSVHGVEISRERAKTGTVAIRRACEVAMGKLKDEGMLEKVCSCHTLREGSKRMMRAKKV